MKLKTLFTFFYSFTLISSFNELSQLSSMLNTLQNISEKYYSSEAFYQDLYETLIKVTKTQNTTLFDKYPHLKSLLTLMFEKEFRGYYQNTPVIILSLIQTYEQIIKTYKPTSNLHIVSHAGSVLLQHERLLLHALVKAGYHNISFYSIDPMSPNSLKGFENEHNELENIKYRKFKVSQDYINEVIKNEGTIPQVCITITPGTPFFGGNNFNYFSKNKDNEILITPETLKEISILANPENQDNIIEFNNKLLLSQPIDRLSLIRIFDPKISKLELQFKGLSKMIGQYGLEIFHESLLVDFFELIKLASIPTKDCIVCHCCWFKIVDGIRQANRLHIVHYKNIAKQSIAALLKKALLYPNDWKTYMYNQATNQFEIE